MRLLSALVGSIERWCAGHPADADDIRECAANLAAMPAGDDDHDADANADDPALGAITERVHAQLEVAEEDRDDEPRFLRTEVHQWPDPEPLTRRLTATDRFRAHG